MVIQQVVQEDQYLFPYHYLPQWESGFSQVMQMRWGYEYAAYTQYLVSKIASIEWNSMLDVGCGDGRLLHEISKAVTDRSLSGIDYFEQAINFAKIMTESVGWYCGDVRGDNVFDKKFDLITLIEVLEHIDPKDIHGFLKGIHNKLESDGIFIVSVPHKNLGLQKKHYQHFDVSSLGAVLSDFFEIKDVIYLNRKLRGFKKTFLRLFSNKHYAITSHAIADKLYRYYLNHMLHASENDCRRLVVVCRKIDCD